MATFWSEEDDEVNVTKSWSMEEREAYLQSLEDAVDDDEPQDNALLCENPEDLSPEMLAALVSLRDDGESISDLAVAAKERGNKHFATACKVKNAMFYAEAAKQYSDGVALCKAADAALDDAAPEGLEAIMLSNRAACSLARRNYGQATRDCKAALELDATCVKACYRLARACLALKQWEKAHTAAKWGLGMDGANEPLKKAALDAKRGGEAAAASERACEARLAALRHEHEAVFEACAALGVRLGPSALAPSAAAKDKRPRLDEGTVRWSIVFAYPEQRDAPHDCVDDVATDDLLAVWLATVFPEAEDAPPAPWDARGEYRASNVAVYARSSVRADAFGSAAEFSAHRTAPAPTTDADEARDCAWRRPWLELSPCATLQELLTHQLYLVDGAIELEVRPRKSAQHAAWRAKLEKRAPVCLVGIPLPTD